MWKELATLPIPTSVKPVSAYTRHDTLEAHCSTADQLRKINTLLLATSAASWDPSCFHTCWQFGHIIFLGTQACMLLSNRTIDTIYLEIESGYRSKGLSPTGLLLTSDASCKPRLLPMLLADQLQTGGSNNPLHLRMAIPSPGCCLS